MTTLVCNAFIRPFHPLHSQILAVVSDKLCSGGQALSSWRIEFGPRLWRYEISTGCRILFLSLCIKIASNDDKVTLIHTWHLNANDLLDGLCDLYSSTEDLLVGFRGSSKYRLTGSPSLGQQLSLLAEHSLSQALDELFRLPELS